MKDRVHSDIGAKRTNLTSWSEIDWQKVMKKVKNLRQRIYRATKLKQWNRVRSLTKLMLRSYSNLLLSVSRVTEINKGKNTPGIDGYLAKTPEQRVRLVNNWDFQIWKIKPTKRIYIPKANGKKRPLGIPTVNDRVAQAIIKNALEPSWEVRFENNSFGFRPGRGCHDAIEGCFYRFRKGSIDNWVLDADIKGAFDNISHEFILKKLEYTPGREFIKKWLKAGYVESQIFNRTDKGTPQGGILSPLLANIALDGMDNWLSKITETKVYGKSKGGKEERRIYGFIRYADDFIVTAQTKNQIEAIIPRIQEWLAIRGLHLNKEKTIIRNINDGFDFLGFNIRKFNGKCIIKPQKEKVAGKLNQIKTWLKEHPNAKPSVVIDVLNPILRGWGNYYKHGVSKETFAYFDHRLVKMLIKWINRRHPSKGIEWATPKYFGRIKGDRWVFKAKTKDRQGKDTTKYLFRLATIPIVRHVKVKGDASPDDPKLKEYWEKRKTKVGKNYYAKGSKLYRVAESQNWKCPICNQHLFNQELIETHHKKEVAYGGTDEECNLIHVHQKCHRQLHGKRAMSR